MRSPELSGVLADHLPEQLSTPVDRILGLGDNEPSIGDLHRLRDVVEPGLLDGPESPAGKAPF
jgi:hypothetical protein